MATTQFIAHSRTGAGVKTGADVVVETLKRRGTTHVFGVPGAKIDRVYDRLRDSSIKTVVCRHDRTPLLSRAAPVA